MKLKNVNNIKVIRKYRRFLLEAKGLNQKSVEKMERAIHLYRESTNDEDFKFFTIEKAIEFKNFLKARKFRGKNLSANSYRTYLIHLKKFFGWLAKQSGYKSRIKLDAIEYLTVSKKDNRMAAQRTIKRFPTLEYMKELADSVDTQTEVGLRNRALIAFAALTGIRDGAIISLPMMSIIEDGCYVIQDPKEGADTKFGKTIYSKIFKFDPDLFKYFFEWFKYLKEKGFSDVDPLFPRSKIKKVKDNISFQESTEVEPVFWKNTESLRKIFRRQSKLIHKEYYSPHRFRDAAIYLALKSCRNGEQIKAVSQNFGHEDVATIISVYAQLSPERQLAVLDQLSFNGEATLTEEELLKLLRNFRRGKSGN
jgi:site-specific recombinase XerD